MRRTIAPSLFLALFALACSGDSPLGTLAQPTLDPASAKAPSVAGAYDGLWVESPTARFALGNGTYQEVWVEFTLALKGSSYTGTARRYVSYYNANMAPIALRIDLGTPGRVSATETAAGINVGITRLSESKLNIGYQLGADASKNVLTNLRPTTTSTAVGFVRSTAN